MKLPLTLAVLSHVSFLTSATIAPPGCLKLKTDDDWPAPSVWKDAMPGIIHNMNATDRGTLPDYRFRVKNVSDVQLAVKFANKHGIRVTVITTGHDQLGRNDAGSGLIIDLSYLTGVKVLESFTPSKNGCDRLDLPTPANVITPKPGLQAAVTFGPAVGGLALNYAIANSSLFVVTAAAGKSSAIPCTCPVLELKLPEARVANSGGWGQNGGYGPLTSQYGLGVDQWLEAKIVTADGELKVANNVTNTDLFWAIRGGGGGTFGVVVESTWKAHPVVPITGFNWYINSTLTGANLTNLETGETPVSAAMEYMFAQMPRLNAMGITGYFYLSAFAIRCFAVHPANNSGVANANAVWGPILSHLQSLPNMTQFQTKAYNFQNYKEYFDGTYGPLAPQVPNATITEPKSRGIVSYDSRLLAPEHLKSGKMAYALRGSRGAYGVLLTAPGMKHGNGKDTSANPSWRNASALIVGYKSPTANFDGLRELAPDMGTYINEVFHLDRHLKE